MFARVLRLGEKRNAGVIVLAAARKKSHATDRRLAILPHGAKLVDERTEKKPLARLIALAPKYGTN
jgi:hypothetical protein